MRTKMQNFFVHLKICVYLPKRLYASFIYILLISYHFSISHKNITFKKVTDYKVVIVLGSFEKLDH